MYGYSDKFCDLLSSIKGKVLVCGDFNYSGIDWDRLHAVSPAERRVLDTSQDHFWTQYVDFPTHVGASTVAGQEEERNGKTLDLALSNTPELVVGVEDLGLFRDHRMFAVDLVCPESSSGQTLEMVPDWSKGDMDQIVALPL